MLGFVAPQVGPSAIAWGPFLEVRVGRERGSDQRKGTLVETSEDQCGMEGCGM